MHMGGGGAWRIVAPLALLLVLCSVQGGVVDNKAHGVAQVMSCQDQKTDHRRTIGPLRPVRSGGWRRQEGAHAQARVHVRELQEDV